MWVHLLHFELNYFTGVNRLTPPTELLHTSKNEVNVIPSLPAQSWKSSISTRCFTPRLAHKGPENRNFSICYGRGAAWSNEDI